MTRKEKIDYYCNIAVNDWKYKDVLEIVPIDHYRTIRFIIDSYVYIFDKPRMSRILACKTKRDIRNVFEYEFEGFIAFIDAGGIDRINTFASYFDAYYQLMKKLYNLPDNYRIIINDEIYIDTHKDDEIYYLSKQIVTMLLHETFSDEKEIKKLAQEIITAYVSILDEKERKGF